jgi:CheY-specific phosphatase CheX
MSIQDNRQSIIDALHSAITVTFERMAFIEVMTHEVETTWPSWVHDAVGSTVMLRGKLSFNLTLLMHRGHARRLFKTVYDNELKNESLLQDFLEELTNTFGGRFVDSYCDKEKVLSISIPHNADIPSLIATDIHEQKNLLIRFEVENGTFLCFIEEE